MTAFPKPLKSERKLPRVDTTDLALPKPNVARDSDYRAFVRKHPCAIKGHAEHRCAGPIEAAHIRTAGFALKASDYAVVPLCERAHRFSDDGTLSQHDTGWSAFMIRYDFNPWHVAFWLLENWHRIQMRERSR